MTSDSKPIRIGAVLLAAGASTRMGRPKLLLPWGSASILEHQLNLWKQLHATQVAVVCAPGEHPVARELDRLGFPLNHRIINPTPEEGMFSSIQTAARWSGWMPNLTNFALILGDQPQVSIATLQRFVQFAADHSKQICQPSRGGRLRHPVILPTRLFAELTPAAQHTLKEFLAKCGEPVAACEVDDPAVDFDIDTPADYQRALNLFVPGQSRPESIFT